MQLRAVPRRNSKNFAAGLKYIFQYTIYAQAHNKNTEKKSGKKNWVSSRKYSNVSGRRQYKDKKCKKKERKKGDTAVLVAVLYVMLC